MDYEDGNVPFGVSSTDAAAAGINSWDTRQAAHDKIQTQFVERQGEAQRTGYAAQDAARNQQSSSYQPARGVAYTGAERQKPPVKLTELQHMESTCILTTSGLARIIERDRQYLESERERRTKLPRQLRTVTFVVLGLTAFMVIFGLKLPLIPYQYGLLEYWGVRALLVAAIGFVFKFSSTIAKAHTHEEKRFTTIAQCFITTLKRSYKVKVPTVEKDCSARYLLGRFDVPSLALTAEFLQQLNQCIETKTGEPMPYTAYRFTDAKPWGRAFFIPVASTVDPQIAPYAVPVPMMQFRA